MEAFGFPSRKGLIVGAVKASLYGLELRRVQELRHSGVENWPEDAELKEIRRVGDAVYGGQAATTRNREILSMLAYTQQTMRVSHDEWQQVVRVSLEEVAS